MPTVASMRRLVAVLSSAAIALGVLVGVATPTNAADLGTVTFTGGASPSVNPSVVTGSVGDTFTIGVSGGGTVMNVVGAAVSDSSGACDPGCFGFTSGASPTFTISGAGSVVLEDSNALGMPSTTLTIVIGGGSSGPTDPALVYPTAYLNANGGYCPGARMQATKSSGPGEVRVVTSSDYIFLPPDCFRTGYTLGGWARSADATTSDFETGGLVPIGDESFTLYAVWVPTGSLITYDANVGADTVCVDAAGAEVPAGEGRVSTALNPTILATSAPCSPNNNELVLSGWATSGDGPVAYGLGAPASFPAGTRQHLYAVWQPTKAVTCVQGRATPLASISCTDFGYVHVGWTAVLEVRVTNNSMRSLALDVQPIAAPQGLNGTLERVDRPGDCNAAVQVPGRGSCVVHFAWTPADVSFLAQQDVPLTVCASAQSQCYRTPAGQGLRGSAYRTLPARPAQPVVPKTIVITGERGEVDGKPGVTIVGRSEGFEGGDRLTPVLIDPDKGVVFGSPLATVQFDGTFTWRLQTVKAVKVDFVSEDASVRSNRVNLPVGESIVITGERFGVAGVPTVGVDGTATGLAAGAKVKPWIRFPGQTEYVAGSARPVVGEDGTFFWQRKTDKKIYVVFTNEDASKVSNRVIIPAE